MGGQSSTSQNTSGTQNLSQSQTQNENQNQNLTQSGTKNPWDTSTPALQGILSQLQGNLNNTGVTGAENNALDTITNNANSGSATFAPQINDFAKTLFNGGGATDQAGNVNQNYQDYYKATNPLASNTNYNPYDTPGFRDAINTATTDITNGVNGSFAAAGRDFSGANSMALGRGIMQGVAPTIAAQYNQNVQNQQGAAGNLYGAGNTNAGILAGLQQQKLTNQGQGVTAAGQATDAANAGPNAALAAEAARRGIPVAALGLLAQIGIPIAGLGGTTSGTSNGVSSGTSTGSGTSNGTSTGQTQGTAQMAGADQFLKIMQGFGSLIPKGPISFGG